MDIPPPPTPTSLLDGWRRTEATVDTAFSTPVISVYTHTLVYEATDERERISEQTGVDRAWRFFFVSRIRLDPPQRPSMVLTSLVRREAARGFVDRLEARGFSQIDDRDRKRMSIGHAEGIQKRYRAVCRLDREALATADGMTGETPLSLPVEAVLAVWHVDGEYHVAGGAYPSGLPDSGPSALVAALGEQIDPSSFRNELLELIDGCGRKK